MFSFAFIDFLFLECLVNWKDKTCDIFLAFKALIILMKNNICSLCNSQTSTKECPNCGKPVCKECSKSFPFSEDICIECAANVKSGLGGMRKDEEIF